MDKESEPEANKTPVTAQLNDSERVTDGVSFDVWNIEWIHWCEEYRAGSLPQTDVKDNKTSKLIQFTSYALSWNSDTLVSERPENSRFSLVNTHVASVVRERREESN
ncbi:unnamed protein product [Leuciscus chuanchicus]